MGRGRLSALASLNQIFPSFSLLASENPLRSSLRVCLKKKKEKEKVSNDLIVRAKTDDLKKKKKSLETIVQATIKITSTFAS